MPPPTGRILVVDDDENNRDMLARRLLNAGNPVAMAEDGPTALAAIDREPFDLILLDIEMPGMTGFEVLRAIRQKHAATQLPVIIATARNDRKDIVLALDLGANDFVTKPIDFAVVQARVRTQLSHKFAMDQVLQLETDLRRRNEELEHANARMRESLELAGRMQQSLLPASPLRAADLDFVWVYEPCDELGGDIFNVAPLGDGKFVGMYLLDVSGHGVPAALLSVTLSRLLSTVPGETSVLEREGLDGMEPRSPQEVASELNLRFQMSAGYNQYFTMFYGLLDVERSVLRYVTAGHPPALYLPVDGPARFLEQSNFAIGWFTEAVFAEAELPMRPGDRLFIYSDGCTETMNADHEQFGQERVSSAFSDNRGTALGSAVSAVMQAVKTFRGTCEVLDDVSALSLELAAP